MVSCDVVVVFDGLTIPGGRRAIAGNEEDTATPGTVSPLHPGTISGPSRLNQSPAARRAPLRLVIPRG